MSVEAMRLAGAQMGLNERDQNAALSEYMANGGVNLDPAVTAWCAAFVNASLAQAGQEGTGSNMARSFMEWGQPVDTPQPGDVAVFSRGDPNGPYGHVGFFQGYDDNGNIRVLGGNQGDSVSVASYGADRLLGFRRAGESGSYDPARPPSVFNPPPNALASMPQSNNNMMAMMNAMRPPQLQSNALDPADFRFNPYNARTS